MPHKSFVPKLWTLIQSGDVRRHFKGDCLAGLTVAVVALPLAMAIAIASGATPDKGLVTAVVAGFIISLMGGSRVQIGGPTGAFIVVVFNVIAEHGYDGLLLATFMAGLILLIAGYARIGTFIRYISPSVITGFTAGIAVIIASSQMRDFSGLQVEDIPADFIDKWRVYLTHLDKATPAAIAIGIVSFLLIMVLKRRAPKIPGYLIAVIGSALAVYVLHLPVETIGSRFPDIPHGLPMPRFPDWSVDKLIEVIPSAFIIAFLAGIEALLSATVADGMTCNKHRCNQELVGQGTANIITVFFGGLPATGAIARTATNIHAGGKTPVAGIMHAVFLLLFMVFAMDAMRFVPLAALAAILLVVSWYMSESKHFTWHLKERNIETLAMLVTFFLTVLVDLTVGIFSGVAVTALAALYRKYKNKNMPAR